eukprot:TRINITY_DN13875_c0_g1_i1.p1 TRINITY_DN13875_c0_g1~~TRINITY_DN13875_c0_g1_i1.p1  ORF type:complete len:321 (+),score=53.29 TRINITY_DN13875_c0_g1_i1:42-1004(+)
MFSTFLARRLQITRNYSLNIMSKRTLVREEAPSEKSNKKPKVLSKQQEKRLERIEKLQKLTDAIKEKPEGEDRFVANAQQNLTFHRTLKTQKNFCGNCWLKKQICICNGIQKFSTKNRLLLFLHYKEYMRSSNTGVLTVLGNPESSTLYLSGKLEDEKALKDQIEKHPHDTFILFPEPKAITLSEFLELRKTRYEQSNLTVSPDVPLNAIVLDGTWRQVKSLRKRLPDGIPFVKLSNSQLSINTLRTQSTLGRISTAEAIAELLKELGEDPNEIQKLERLLELRIHAVNYQCRRITREQWNSNLSEFTKLPTDKSDLLTK